MKNLVLKLIGVIVVICLAYRCAQVVPLSGGKKDVTPPKLVESYPKNNSVNFKYAQISLLFDEYVQVRDVANQLIISPRLKTPPIITATGRKVVIELEQKELALNTTYRFSFGKTIADMNEANPLENFEYVFSTGNTIDTLQIKGVVSDAFSNNKLADITVGLYKSSIGKDSIPFLFEPDYIARSNESGEFAFRNLPPTNFEVYAIQDKNKNALYEIESEKIGFLNSQLLLDKDSTINITMFPEATTKSFIKKTISPFYGFTQIVLNKKAQTSVTALKTKDTQNIAFKDPDKLKDTVVVFYKTLTDSLSLLFNNQTAGKIDTLNILIPKNNQIKRTFQPVTVKTPVTIPVNKDFIRISFLNWMDTGRVNLNQIQMTSADDSLISKQRLTGAWTQLNEYLLSAKFKEGSTYGLKIDTGAFYNVYKNPNDSLKVSFKTKSAVEFGKVTLNLKLNKKQSYVIQLINDQMQVVKEQTLSFSLSSSNAAKLDFTELPAGTYQVKIIYDDNNNQKWDSGSVLKKIQPEMVSISSKQLKVLADWEIEEEIIEK